MNFFDNLFSWNQKHTQNRGWFIGSSSFIENSFLSSEYTEVKWNTKIKGWKHQKPSKNSRKTITILISGKLKISFPQEGRSVVLSKQGDFSFHEAGTLHLSEALTDVTTITIRYK